MAGLRPAATDGRVFLKRIIRCTLILLNVIVGSAILSAHHSTTAEFDVTRRMTLSGTLTKVDWVNPHIVVFVDAKGRPSRSRSRSRAQAGADCAVKCG